MEERIWSARARCIAEDMSCIWNEMKNIAFRCSVQCGFFSTARSQRRMALRYTSYCVIFSSGV
jgi:hypothetical protein